MRDRVLALIFRDRASPLARGVHTVPAAGRAARTGRSISRAFLLISHSPSPSAYNPNSPAWRRDIDRMLVQCQYGDSLSWRDTYPS